MFSVLKRILMAPVSGYEGNISSPKSGVTTEPSFVACARSWEPMKRAKSEIQAGSRYRMSGFRRQSDGKAREKISSRHLPNISNPFPSLLYDI